MIPYAALPSVCSCSYVKQNFLLESVSASSDQLGLVRHARSTGRKMIAGEKIGQAQSQALYGA